MGRDAYIGGFMSNKTDPIYMRDGVGLVELYDWMSMDPSLKAVNVARASFGKRQTTFDFSKDKKFLDWLAQNLHSSPFRHSYITLYVHCPEVVARQWFKHVVGSDYSYKDLPWNELSGRYVEYSSFYTPQYFYFQAKNRKQGRTDEVHPQSENFKRRYDEVQEASIALYKEMAAAGIAMEQARLTLPLSTYTSFYWTVSPQAVMHFVSLRNKPDAQAEIREYAEAVAEIGRMHYTHLWDSMETYWK